MSNDLSSDSLTREVTTSMRILLAIDGSPHSQTAVDEVARRPWPSKSQIRLLSVIQPYAPPATEFVLAGATFEDMRQQQVSSAKEIMERAAESLKKSGLSTETAVREGDPRSAIVDEADDWGADLIVVGSHGRTGLARWLLGSVAQAVVGHASCSVEVVRRREPKGGKTSAAS
jgi:nucleotide-binding universal stress UspA family protein